MKVGILVVLSILLGAGAGISLAISELGTPTSGDIWDASQLVTKEEFEKRLDQLGPRPKVVMPELSHDFGVLELSTTGEHDFVVRNEGTAPLHPRVGETSCGCTVGKLANDVVPPGGETTITVKWQAGHEGKFRETATLKTNDPIYPSFTLVVTGEVKAPARIVPKKFTFPELNAEEFHEEKFKVLVFHLDELNLSKYYSLNPDLGAFFQVKMEPMTAEEAKADGARCGFNCTLSIKPGLPRGPFQQTIRLVPDPELAFPLDLVITGNGGGESQMLMVGRGWDRNKSRLNLGIINSSEGLNRKWDILLRGEGHAEANLKVAKVYPEELKVTLGEPIPLGEGVAMRYPLNIEIPPGTKSLTFPGITGDDVGTIVIESTHPNFPPFTIHVVVNVVE